MRCRRRSVYTEGFLKAVDVEAVQSLNSQVVIDYAYSTASQVLPEIMNRLGSRTIALNATVDESKMAISLDELQQGLAQLSAIVPALKADLAARLDVSGERLCFVDDRGTSLSPTTSLAVMAVLAWRVAGGGTLAIPVTQPMIFERLAQRLRRQGGADQVRHGGADDRGAGQGRHPGRRWGGQLHLPELRHLARCADGGCQAP